VPLTCDLASPGGCPAQSRCRPVHRSGPPLVRVPHLTGATGPPIQREHDPAPV